MSDKKGLKLMNPLRSIFVAGSILGLSACAWLPFSENTGIGRIPLEDIEPTVRFIEKKEEPIPQSDIDEVSTEQVVESYERLMQSPHPEVQRQAMRRLADLNMRLAGYKAYALDSGQELESLSPAIRNASYAKAAELYQQTIDQFPRQEDDSAIRYQLSRALSLDGKQEQSLEQLDSLVAVHTASPEVVEVEFRRGEAYFLRKDYRRAADAYKAVLDQGTGSQYYDKALYKHGWSLFKLRDYDLAILDFFPLLERLLSEQQLNSEVKAVLTDLIDDTYRAISLSFYHQAGAETVEEYFKTVGPKPYEYMVYERLAQLYLEQERFQDAADTYLAFVSGNEFHEQAPYFQLKVVQTYIDGGFPSLVLPAKEEFLKKYGVKSRFWRQATEIARKDLRPHVRLNLDEIASHYHANAQESKKPADYLTAAEWYSHFLLLLNDEKDVAPFHFLMAEALFDAKDYQRAIVEFEQIAYTYKQYEKREQAAYNILVAYQTLIDNEKQDEAKKALKSKSIEYTLKYADVFPNSKRAPELVLRAAEELIVFERIPEAIAAAEKLLALPGQKTQKQADRAKIIIANGLLDLKQYAKAESAITRVLNETQLTQKQRDEFREQRAQSIYKQAEALKEEGKLEFAMTEFQRLSALEPNSSVRVNADYDAATIMLQLEKWDDARTALESFRKQFGKHELAKGLSEKLALVYEKQELWGLAAGEYKSIGATTKDPEKAREISWYVAELYKKADQTTEAIAAYKKYVWTYPEPYVQATEGRAKLVELYKQAGDSEKRDFWHAKIISEYKKAKDKNNARTSYLAANSSFELAEPLFESFQNIKLKLPLAKSLRKKKSAMDKAIKAYGDIGKFKVAEFTTASTHRVAQLYHVLAKDILNSERPKGMNEEEEEEYGYLIEDQAFPLEEKAIEIYQSNSNRVLQNVYDEWVKLSFAALADLQPARYNKQEVIKPWYGVSL
ncbi:tetratricopeptide repeat protein [Pleionea sp. CnH1-48]|uniref:tetratricopeptide repeat protein n=1 Tax=Pleionea sp. CnH1-48 TaxID=2954494 RepID=UPI002097465B|nr:tetratricopeptide repeat protein [Pleionea sp. CnH1-48]MCO7223070.1 tetratricopeptide repeat protein [Pleionea sp. CnH1-48]